MINPLSVLFLANGKKRLILDLKHVNKIAKSYFSLGVLMFFSLDLKSGQRYIEIFKDHKVYLGISCLSGCLLRLAFLPRRLKPLEKHWRHQGICVAIFLDDGWGIEKDCQVCCAIANAVRPDLSRVGFITNDEKSVWGPC